MDDEVYEEYQRELKHKESALSKENASPVFAQCRRVPACLVQSGVVVVIDKPGESCLK